MNKLMTYFYAVAVLAIAVTVSSCSNDEGVEDNTPRPVKFTAGIDKQTATPGTRAAGTTWASGDAIGVFMVETTTANIAEGAANKQHTNTGGNNFAPESGHEIYYPVAVTDQVDFIAYYPYQSSITTQGTYRVDVSNQSNQAAIDLLYSNNATGKNKNSGNVALTFDHQLTRLVIKTEAGDGLTDAELQGMTVTIKEMKTTADFDLATGTLTKSNPVADITPRTKTDGVEYEAIVLPEEFAANKLVMTFTIGGDTFTWKNPTADDGKLEPGKEYTYTMTISRTEVRFTCAINSWSPIPRAGTAN